LIKKEIYYRIKAYFRRLRDSFMSKKKLLIIGIVCFVLVIGIVIFLLTRKKVDRSYEVLYEKEYNYFLLNVDDYYGVISKSGKVVINPEYDEINIPNRDYAIFEVTKDDEQMILNEKNEELFKGKNVSVIEVDDSNIDDNIEVTSDTTRMKYESNEKYGLIDFSGKEITDPIYEEIISLPGKYGEYRVKKDGKYGVISNKGIELVKIKYDFVEGDGYIDKNGSSKEAGYIVGENKGAGLQYGYLDKNEHIILKMENENISRLSKVRSGDLYLVVTQNGRCALYSSKKKHTDYSYIEIEYAIDDEKSSDQDMFLVKKNKKSGLLNKDLNVVVDTKYDDIYISGMYINATIGEENYIFTLDGKKIDDNKYIGLEKTSTEKYYIAQMENENYTILDTNKKKVINTEYDFIREIEDTDIIAATKNNNITIYSPNIQKLFSIENATLKIVNNYIKIVNADKTAYFTMDGKEVDNTTVYLKNEIFAKEKNGKWGFVDIEGKVVVDYIYDRVTEVNEYGFAGINLNGKWGVVNKKGKVILKPTYESDVEDPNFVGKYVLNGKECSTELY